MKRALFASLVSSALVASLAELCTGTSGADEARPRFVFPSPPPPHHAKMSIAAYRAAVARSRAWCNDAGERQDGAPEFFDCRADVEPLGAVPADAGRADAARGDAGAKKSRGEEPLPAVGTYLRRECREICPPAYTYCKIEERTDASVTVFCGAMATGRSTSGYAGPNGAPTGDPGAHFATMAELETVSITAFRELARDLERHRAPRPLVNRCRRAAREEVEHARRSRSFAKRLGARPDVPRIDKAEPKSLFELARENAVEGCVRETFGALVAHYQAMHADDPQLRAMMQRIAKDETNHAALSFQIDAWARSRLTASERRSVEEARARAVSQLRESVVCAEPSSLPGDIGMPDRAANERLFSAFLVVLDGARA